VEQGLVTSGDDLKNIAQFLPANQTSYCAADVIAKLLAPVEVNRYGSICTASTALPTTSIFSLVTASVPVSKTSSSSPSQT
jgi:hypothetical protein